MKLIICDEKELSEPGSICVSNREMQKIVDQLKKWGIDFVATAQQNMHRTGCKADHDMMLYAGVETCPACGQSTRPPVM